VVQDFFQLTEDERAILSEIGKRLLPHADEILAEWNRILEEMGPEAVAPLSLEQAQEMNRETMYRYLQSLEAGTLEQYIAWLRERVIVHLHDLGIPLRQMVGYFSIPFTSSLRQVYELFAADPRQDLAVRALAKYHDLITETMGEAALEVREQALLAEQERLQRRTRQLEVSIEVSRELTTALELEALFSRIVNLLQRSFGFYHVHIYILDEESGYLLMQEGTGEPGRIMKERGHRIPLGRGLVGRAAQTGEPVLVPDVSQEPDWLPNPLLPETRAELSVPIKMGDRVIGVLDIQSDKIGGLTEEDLNLVVGLSGQIAVAIENARLFEAEQRRRQEMETLHQAAQALSATLDLDKIFELILTQLRQVVPYDSASVQILKDDRLELIGGHGFPNLPELLGLSFPVDGDNPNREVVRRRAPFIVDDAPAIYSEFRKEPHAQAGIRSWLGVPLLFGDRLIGMLALDKREPHFYTQEHARLAMAFATQAAIAIENARFLEETRRRLQEQEMMFQASMTVLSARDEEEILREVITRMAQALDMTSAYVCLYDQEDSKTTRVTVEYFGPEAGEKERASDLGQIYQESKQFLEKLALRRPIVFHLSDPDLPPEEREHFERYGAKTVLYVPLIVRDKVIGYFELWESRAERRVTGRDMDFCQTMANLASVALENMRLLQETSTRMEELQRAYETQQELLEMVRKLATPIVPVLEGIIVLPLVGVIDAQRAQQIIDSLLSGIEEYGALVALIDITGVPMVDSEVAGYLLQAVDSARLLGAEAILVGIRPEIAETLVDLGVDLSDVVTRSDLQSGVEYALELMGLSLG